MKAAAFAAWCALSLIGGCASLLPQPAALPSLFALEEASTTTQASPGPLTPQPRPAADAPTLIVSATRAAAGFDSAQIVYRRQASEIEYFANHQWVEPPSQMLGPLIRRAVERTGAYRAVLQAPTGVAGQLRLDTELVRLQQEFFSSPSRVRLTLHAVLIDTTTRRVVAWRTSDASVPVARDDPRAGVAAAQQAVQQVMLDLAAFCAEPARP